MTFDYTAIRCEPLFGSGDSNTGWWGIEWSESSVEMKIIPKGTTGFHTPVRAFDLKCRQQLSKTSEHKPQQSNSCT